MIDVTISTVSFIRRVRMSDGLVHTTAIQRGEMPPGPRAGQFVYQRVRICDFEKVHASYSFKAEDCDIADDLGLVNCLGCMGGF